ncbi:C39 family peptidase [Candidatus Uhrbacteria bacterium]|nr:C39 family peptidase [Candidatus Uhrbacteria bacterium]
MRALMLSIVLLSSFVLFGCPAKDCDTDNDCCRKPNPAYFCNSGMCTYNPYVANDYAVYNYRVQQCNNPNGSGDNPGGSGGGGSQCESDLPANPDGVQLPVPEMPQQCQAWCWAASISMVASYYGKYVQECELAGYKSGYGYSCCSMAACASGCNQTATPQEIATIFTQMGFYGKFLSRALTEHELQVELSSGRPVYVMFQGSFSGHAVIITGFMGGYYHVVDPWYGPQNIPYNSVLWGPNGEHWTYTISRLSPYSDGCSPGFNPDCAVCH